MIQLGALGKLPGRVPGAEHGPRGLGLILEWARDYGRDLPRHQERRREKERAFAAAAEHSEQMAEELKAQAVAGARRELADPRASDRDRQLAREVLADYGVSEESEEGG